MLPVLHVSDFHFHLPAFHWCRRVAANFSAVACTGDFLDSSPDSSTPAIDQVAWVTQWVRDFPVPLWLASGNHDHDREDLPRHLQRWVTKLKFKHVTTDGRRTTHGSWEVECVGWGEVPQAESRQCLALVHCPPAGAETAIESAFRVDYGDFDLGEILRHGFQPPELVLSGHVHQRRRFYDRVGYSLSLNPGAARAKAAYPNHIILDLDVRTAELVSATEGRKTVPF